MTTPWVMFGTSHLFGDFFDLIHDSGGRLRKIVINVPEKPWAGRLSIQERLYRLPYAVEIQSAADWKPDPDCEHVVGFSRRIMVPMLEDLQGRQGRIPFKPLIHSKAVIQYGARFGDGAIVNAGAILGSWAEIRAHSIVNRGANVGHDCIVSEYSFLAPGATLCSHVRIGENVFVGAGAIVLPDVHVGDNAVIAAGAVVLENVPPGAMVAGVPAVIKKQGAS